ncbi:hypothetical protein K435DRAFT_878135 [Dendrothele bispora CBS 962.96]|uniref:Uncharacterized protein n=1 Tax=Dendrothele bispora (strain CBS 962.96) TaxID=1314807 RepID=A0A4S8KNM7_DENBC|nr:hypothetical protein K435DRAFT_878135 [Dendrothele bispora CBS 962.96]
MDALIDVPAELIIAIASLCHRKTLRALAETNRRCCQLVQPLVFQTVRISSITQLRHLAQFFMAREDIGRKVTSISIEAKSLIEQAFDLDSTIQGDIIDNLKQVLSSSRAKRLSFKGLGGGMHGSCINHCCLAKSLVELVSITVERGLRTLKIVDSMVSLWSMIDLLSVLGDHDMDALELLCCAPTPTSRDEMDLHSFDAENVLHRVSDYLDRRATTVSTKQLWFKIIRLFACDLFCAIIAGYVKAVGRCHVVSMLFWCQENAVLRWWLEVMAKKEGFVEGLKTIWMIHPGVGCAMSFVSESLRNLSHLNHGLQQIGFTVVDWHNFDPISFYTVALKNDYLKVLWTTHSSWKGVGAEVGRSAFWDATTRLENGHLEDSCLLKELFLHGHLSRLDRWSSEYGVRDLRYVVDMVEMGYTDA